MIDIKKLLVLLALIGVAALSGYLYFDRHIINAKSELDKKSKQEQTAEILNNQEFENLPEVKELKQQVNQFDQQKDDVSGAKVNAPGGVPSQADIENKLKQKLAALQSEYNGKISGLLAAARKEYSQIQSGQISVSKRELAEKYIGLAESIEAQCDARVYAAIAYAENELIGYGYQSSVPGEARQVYQSTKSERRKQLLSKLY